MATTERSTSSPPPVARASPCSTSTTPTSHRPTHGLTSFGSSHQNWKSVKAFCDGNNMLFVPSVGPGYIDAAVRPWNNHNTRNRVNGRYYETALQAALSARPDIVSITSFNEWHEGTQIERAAPKKTVTRVYLDYLPHGPDHYLELTRHWAEQFNKEKEQWLM